MFSSALTFVAEENPMLKTLKSLPGKLQCRSNVTGGTIA